MSKFDEAISALSSALGCDADPSIVATKLREAGKLAREAGRVGSAHLIALAARYISTRESAGDTVASFAPDVVRLLGASEP